MQDRHRTAGDDPTHPRARRQLLQRHTKLMHARSDTPPPALAHTAPSPADQPIP
jgi:hypothetical protein